MSVDASTFVRRRPVAVWLRVLAVVALWGVGARAAPTISCAEPEFDFGEHDASKPVVHTFVVNNEGDDVLEIGRVRACCGASASISSKQLAPGEEARLTVKLRLSNRHGYQNKTVWIGSNDPERPLFRLRLKGMPVHGCRFSERIVDFGSIQGDEPIQRDVTLTWAEDARPERLGIRLSGNAFKGEIIDQNGTGATIRITAQAPLAPGRYNGLLRMTSSGEALNGVSLTIRARVEGEFSVTPSQILLTTGSEDRAVNRFLAVRHNRGEPFRVAGVATDVPGLQAQARRITDSHWRVALTGVQPTPDSIPENACLTLTLDSDITPTLDIPIRSFHLEGVRPKDTP